MADPNPLLDDLGIDRSPVTDAAADNPLMSDLGIQRQAKAGSDDGDQPDNSWWGAIKGDADAALSLGRQAVGGTVGAVGRTANRLIPAFGDEESKKAVKQKIDALQESISGEPYTPEGKYAVQAVGDTLKPFMDTASSLTGEIVGPENVPAVADAFNAIPGLDIAGALPAAAVRGAVRGGSAGAEAMARTAQAAEDAGLKTSVGAASGNPLLKGAENLSSKLPGGKPLAEARDINTQAEASVSDIIKKVDPDYDENPPTPSEAGEEVQRGVKKSIQKGKEQTQDAADAMHDAVGGKEHPLAAPRTAAAAQSVTHQTGIEEIDNAVTNAKAKQTAKVVDQVSNQPKTPTSYNTDGEGAHVATSPNGETHAVETAQGDLKVTRSDTSPAAQGKGEGTDRLETLAHAATSQGKNLVSDVSVSPAEAAAYEKLARRGWEVKKNPNAEVNPDTGNIISDSPKNPVYTVKAPNTSETFIHGTSPENAAALRNSGNFDPSKGTRNYDYSEFGQKAVYASRPGSWWLDKEKAVNGRALPYDSQVPIQFKPGTGVRKITSAADAHKLATDLGYKDVKSLMKDWTVDGLQDSEEGNYDRSASDNLTKKAIDKGIHALDIGPQKGLGEAGEHMAGDQIVALDPSRLAVKTASKGTEGKFTGEWSYDPKTGKSEPTITPSQAQSGTTGGSAQLNPETPWTFQGLRALRTSVGRALQGTTDVGKKVQLSQLYGAMSEDLKSFVKGKGPEAEQKYEFFNSISKQNADNQKILMKAIKEEGGPGEIFNKAMRGNRDDAGRISRVMGAMDEQGKNTFRAVVLHRMGRVASAQGAPFNANTFLTNWDKMSVEAKNVLFGEGKTATPIRKSLDALNNALTDMKAGGQLKSGLGRELQQAGTHMGKSLGIIGALYAIKEFAHPIIGMAENHPIQALGAGTLAAGAVVANPLFSRIMTNPKVINWLTQATKMPKQGIPAMVLGLRQMGQKDQDAKDLANFMDGTGDKTPEPEGKGYDDSKPIVNNHKMVPLRTADGKTVIGVDPATFQ